LLVALIISLIFHFTVDNSDLLIALAIGNCALVPDYDLLIQKYKNGRWYTDLKWHRSFFTHGCYIGLLALLYVEGWSPKTPENYLVCAFLNLSLMSHLIGDLAGCKSIVVFPKIKSLTIKQSRIYLVVSSVVLTVVAWYCFVQS